MDYVREVWRVARLEELCEMDRQGLQPNNTVAQRLPFVGVENVGSGTGVLDFDTDSRVGSNKSTTFRFDPRHVLYAKLRPYLNKVATPDFEGRCSTELVPLLPREGVDRDYLAHLLRRDETVAFVMASVTGARMPRTDMRVLMSMRVPLPPLAEQRWIADILNRVAHIERLRARATDHLHIFAHALFVQMFGDPADNPMEWSVVQLGEVAGQGQYGLNTSATIHEHGIRFIRITDIDGDGNLIENQKISVDPKIANLNKYELAPGDVLIARSGATAGKSYIHYDIGERSVFAGYLIRFRTEMEKLLPQYLFYFLHTNEYWRQIQMMKRVAAQPNVNAKELASIYLPLPPINKQQQFASIVNRSTRAITIASEASKAISDLSASLMNRLLNESPTP